MAWQLATHCPTNPSRRRHRGTFTGAAPSVVSEVAASVRGMYAASPTRESHCAGPGRRGPLHSESPHLSSSRSSMQHGSEGSALAGSADAVTCCSGVRALGGQRRGRSAPADTFIGARPRAAALERPLASCTTRPAFSGLSGFWALSLTRSDLVVHDHLSCSESHVQCSNVCVAFSIASCTATT